MASFLANFYRATPNETLNMVSDDSPIAPFSIDHYKRYSELPLEVMDTLRYSVYIIDYSWIYLFLNKNCREVLGEEVASWIGKSALDVFKDPKFKTIFDSIAHGVNTKSFCNATVYSPLRGGQVNIKGHPLEDCYFLSALALPSKDDLLDELRQELNRRKQK